MLHIGAFWLLSGEGKKEIKSETAQKKIIHKRKKLSLGQLSSKSGAGKNKVEVEKWMLKLRDKYYGKTNFNKLSSTIYCLPYAPNNTFRVSQVEGGKTHKGDHWYAYDFEMPIGTGIHAAQGGHVIMVVDHYHEKAQTDEYKKKGNFIMIYHNNGTMSMYAHLDKAGRNVEVGQTIRTGDLIGYSGNTGYSSGPHLHFEVFHLLKSGKTKSIPVIFNSKQSPNTKLEAGKSYTALPSCTN